jgi:hypothetical protein
MLAMRTMDDIVQAARQNNDEAFAQELQRLFEPFQMEMPENMMQQRNGGR